MSGFQLQRLVMLMEPETGNPHEINGVLNPAAARGPDGQLDLFPRLVALRKASNFSDVSEASPRDGLPGNHGNSYSLTLKPESDPA